MNWLTGLDLFSLTLIRISWVCVDPQNTLIVAPSVIIGTLEPMFFYTRSYSFWGPLDPTNSASVSFFL